MKSLCLTASDKSISCHPPRLAASTYFYLNVNYSLLTVFLATDLPIRGAMERRELQCFGLGRKSRKRRHFDTLTVFGLLGDAEAIYSSHFGAI